MPNGPHNLGVLFVHGMGQQPRGETLQTFVEAIERWLDDAGVPVELPARPKYGRQEPGHLVVEVGGQANRQRWLLAESWWAEEFAAPSYRQFMAWVLLVLPTLCALHVLLPFWWFLNHGGTRQLKKELEEKLLPTRPAFTQKLFIQRKLLYTWWAIIWGLLSLCVVVLIPVVTLFLLALFVVSLPLAAFTSSQKAAKWLQDQIAAVLGDAYVLLRNDGQCASIRYRVDEDLRWLSERCDRVAVVAHSQGSAIVHELLRERRLLDHEDEKLRLLLTMGQAIRKLGVLQELQRRQPGLLRVRAAFSLAGTLAGSVFAVLVARATLDARLQLSDTPWIFGPVAFVLLILAVLWGLSTIFREFFKEDSERLRLPRRDALRWVDCFATADPVPNGPLFGNPTTRPEADENVRVRNFCSAFSDHPITSYLRNAEEFTAVLVKELGSAAGWREPLLEEFPPQRLSEARRKRAQVLIAARLALLAATISVLSIGGARTAVAGWALQGRMKHLAMTLGPWTLTLPDVVLESLVVVGLALLLYLVVLLLWRTWDKAGRAAFFGRTQPTLTQRLANAFADLLHSRGVRKHPPTRHV